MLNNGIYLLILFFPGFTSIVVLQETQDVKFLSMVESVTGPDHEPTWTVTYKREQKKVLQNSKHPDENDISSQRRSDGFWCSTSEMESKRYRRTFNLEINWIRCLKGWR